LSTVQFASACPRTPLADARGSDGVTALAGAPEPRERDDQLLSTEDNSVMPAQAGNQFRAEAAQVSVRAQRLEVIGVERVARLPLESCCRGIRN